MFSRALSRLQPRLMTEFSTRVIQTPSRDFARSLAVLSSANRNGFPTSPRTSLLCSCGCGINGIHTKGDRELVEFLQDEISLEKRNLQQTPSQIDDFTVKFNQAEVTFTKNFHDEKVTVTVNVNHTVESDMAEFDNSEETGASLKSRPSFEVDVQVGSKVMSFTCSFTNPEEDNQNPGENFGINELTIYEGEWKEETYCVSGDILDGVMYDLLMNMLDERGITNIFVEQMSNLCTDYEHNLYVSLLQKVQDFVKRK